MLQRRSPHLCRLLRSPAVSVTLVRSASSTGYHNQQWDRPHDTVRTLQEDHLTQLDRLCSAPAHGSAAYLNRANRLRTGISKRILPFPRSELVSSSAGQPIWSHPSTISSANYSHVNLQQYLPCYAVQCRQFSLSATDYKDVSSPPLPLGDAFESSAKAKWVADATTATGASSNITNTIADLSNSTDAPSTVAQVLSDLPAQGDFASLGLGGYTPIGLIQSSLEFLHVQANLPWWLAIISCTIALRVLMFPLAVKVQANAARLNNIRPQMEKLMGKMKHYQQAGNKTMAAQTTGQLLALYQKNNCNPYKMFLMPVVQIPIFVSFFISIRRMATLPVESLKTGGLFWFTDLTLPDPYYVLPFMACASFIVIMELGGEVGVTNPQVEKMKIFFRAMSILLVPVTATFPTGLFMYWITSSLFSMGQIYLLKFPGIRSRMGIPELVKHPQEDKAKKEGDGFLATVKSNYKSALITSEAKDREAKAKKRYEKMKKDRAPKLYDKPPHLR